jgi:hypothetical protein
MVGQILPNNNEKCYSNFSPKFSQLNTAQASHSTAGKLQLATHCLTDYLTDYRPVALASGEHRGRAGTQAGPFVDWCRGSGVVVGVQRL